MQSSDGLSVQPQQAAINLVVVLPQSGRCIHRTGWGTAHARRWGWHLQRADLRVVQRGDRASRSVVRIGQDIVYRLNQRMRQAAAI